MPIIEQSPLVMECEVIDTYEIDGFKNYICTILNTYIEEDMLDEKDKPDYTKLKPVLFEMPTYKYLRTGDIIGDCVKMGKAYGETLK
jgi:flavin reductase (DIM6/NTAB) family NADH-FMN oxidoreductase RutF